MKRKLAAFLAFIFLAFAYSKSSSSQQEYFRTEWQLIEDGLTKKCYEIKIQNLYSTNLDFNLQAFFSDTNFPVEQINNVEIYEWKAVPKEFPVYVTEEKCDYQVIGNDTQGNPIVDLVCWNETIQNGTVTKNVCDWKQSKMQLAKFLENGKEVLKTNNYQINIPKYESKAKYDDFGNVETENGTKKLKICFNTPIVRTLYGYGSSGKIGIRDLNGNFEEDPWWNSTWLYRRSITINNTANSNTLTDYQVAINLTYDSDMQPDFSDIRFTWYNSTSGAETEIPYWIESKSNSQWAYVWVKVPSIPANSYTTIYVYYKNSSVVSSTSNGSAVFILFEDCDDVSDWIVVSPDTLSSNSTITYDGKTCKYTHGAYGQAYRTFSNPSKYYVYGKMRWADGHNGGFEYASSSNTGANSFTAIFHDATNQLAYYNNSGWQDFLAVVAVNWYEVKTYLNGTSYAIVWAGLDDKNWNTYSAQQTMTPLGTPSNFNYIQFYSASVDTTYFDNIFITKASYPNPEPIYSIGKEEVNIDIYPPTYSSPSHNNTEIGFPTLFYIKFDDNTALHPLGYYIFSTNLTGSWINDSAVNFTTTPSWANVTKLLSTSPGTVVGYRWYAWDNSTNVSNVNVTPIFTLTAVDTKAPIWFNNQTTGSSTYGPNNQHYYSVTWSDNYEPEAWVGAYFSTNMTGSWANYTAARSGNATTYTIVPPAGTHCWRFYAWDSSNNINATPIWCKTVNKATPSPAWVFNPPSPITYSTQTNASCNPGTSDSGYSLNAWRNGTDINSELNQYVLLSAGIWNYTCSITETQNYTSASVTSYYTVNKATPSLQLTIVPSNNVVYPTQTTATGSGCPSQLACNLYRNETLVSNPDIQTLPIGTYLYIYNTSGNQNYTDYSIQSYLYVTEASNPQITIFSPENITYYGNKIIEIKFKVIHQIWNQIPTNVSYDNELIFSSSVNNNTNITITKNVSCGPHFINITSVAQGSSSQLVYFTIACGFEIEAFDEQSLEKICYNLAMMNDTYTYNLNDICNKTALSSSELPAGYTTIIVSNSSYISRTYYANLTEPYYFDVKAYLLQSGVGVYITTFVYSMEEPAGVINALTNAKRFINNSWVIVEQKLTDEQGKGYFYLYPWALYKIEGIKGTKYKQIESYYPNPNYVLYIKLEEIAGEKNKTWVFDTVYVEIKPKERYVANITTFEFTVTALENDLEYYGVKFYKYYKKNYTLLYENEISSSGGTIEFDVNITNHTAERFEFVTYFKRNNYDLWNFTSIYIPWQSKSILPGILAFFASGGFVGSDFAMHFIAVFIAFAASAGIGRKEIFGGIKGASLIFVGVLAFFAIIGMVRWEFIVACGLIALLINFAKGLVI